MVAVGAAGVFAVSQFNGTAQGGAATPNELGTQLLTAIENEDVLGMIDVLSPGERDVFRDPMIDLVSELTRLEVLSPEADLANIEGVDIELEFESVTVRSTNVADIVNVDMRSEATSTVDGQAFPIGELITDNLDPADVTEIRGTVEQSTEELDFSLTAVEEDGRWYFSLFHTLAEQLRSELDPPPDIPFEGLAPNGGESPEAAVDAMLDRIEALDLAGMIQLLNPGEAAALQRYAPLFLDEAQAELDTAPIELAITDREFRVEGSGGQRTVFLDALTIEGTAGEAGESVSFRIEWADDCIRAEADGELFEQCVGEASLPEVDDALAEMPAVQAFLDSLGRALDDIEPIGIELRSHDDRWYVSPTTTVTESYLAVLRALDREEIDELIELAEPAGVEFLDNIFGGLGSGEFDDIGDIGDIGSDSGSGSWEPAPVDVDGDGVVDTIPPADFDGDGVPDPTTPPADLDGDGVPDTTLPGTAPVETTPTDPSADASGTASGWDRCYQEPGVAEATACFQQYIATGEIDASYVPVALRFPECGYAEVSWTERPCTR